LAATRASDMDVLRFRFGVRGHADSRSDQWGRTSHGRRPCSRDPSVNWGRSARGRTARDGHALSIPRALGSATRTGGTRFNGPLLCNVTNARHSTNALHTQTLWAASGCAGQHRMAAVYRRYAGSAVRRASAVNLGIALSAVSTSDAPCGDSNIRVASPTLSSSRSCSCCRLAIGQQAPTRRFDRNGQVDELCLDAGARAPGSP
jgi:hypothetical protein